jgi:hypothetical protein
VGKGVGFRARGQSTASRGAVRGQESGARKEEAQMSGPHSSAK